MQTDRDQRGVAFIPGDYDKSAWLETYVETMSDLKPEMPAGEALRAALHAYERKGWSNPGVAAGLDALLGPET
jgi:hypothetical protein